MVPTRKKYCIGELVTVLSTKRDRTPAMSMSKRARRSRRGAHAPEFCATISTIGAVAVVVGVAVIVSMHRVFTVCLARSTRVEADIEVS
jgi:hypothetical protein